MEVWLNISQISRPESLLAQWTIDLMMLIELDLLWLMNIIVVERTVKSILMEQSLTSPKANLLVIKFHHRVTIMGVFRIRLTKA